MAMTAAIFIIWCTGICLSVCALFARPKHIFNQFNEYRFPNYSRDLNEKDSEFVERHIELIENQQTELSKIKRPFALGPTALVLLFFAMMAVLLILFISSSELSNLLTNISINTRDDSSFLIDPYPSILVFLVAIMIGSIVWIPIMIILAIRTNKQKSAYNLLLPNYETTVGTQEFSDKLKDIRTRIASNLYTALREKALESHKNYSFEELQRTLIYQQSRHVKRLGFASLAFMFLVYIMDAFNFVKITNNQIIYSPAFSFKVTTKNFGDVTSAKYSCVKKDNERHLKLLIELDDGYKFRVRKYRIHKMNAVLDAVDISLINIDEADDWCKSLKF